jgi:hypothetical protein
MTIQPIKSTQSLNLNTNQPHRSVIPGKGKLVPKGFKELYLKERADRDYTRKTKETD